MTGEDRRKSDSERWNKISNFMARIDQRNIDKDLNYAVQEDLIAGHDKRITSLEHSRTQITTLAGVATTGFGAWLLRKLGIV